jgi:hypothetical protein
LFEPLWQRSTAANPRHSDKNKNGLTEQRKMRFKKNWFFNQVAVFLFIAFSPFALSELCSR